MKRILFLLLVIGSPSLIHADGDEHGASESSSGRPVINSIQQLNRLNELISACSPGRSPVAGGSGQLPFTPPETVLEQAENGGAKAPADSGNSEGNSVAQNSPSSAGDAIRGADVYTARCIPCHGNNPVAPDLSSLSASSKAIAVQNGRMPKGEQMSAEDRAALMAYLNQ